MRYIIIYFFITRVLFGFDYHLKPYKLSDKINCFFGLPSQVSKQNGGNMINSCYIETKEGYVVIDSGPTYSYARDTYNIMQKLHSIPVKYVISTAIDDEHVLGNGFFKEQGAIILGPMGYKKKLDSSKIFLLFTLLSKEVMINTRIVPFDKYIKKDTTLFLGTTEINIKVLNEDSARLMVLFSSQNMLFAGDMIYNNRLLSFENNRSLLSWEKNLEQLSILPWDDIVSAHGYMTRRSALKKTQSYLLRLKEQVLKALHHNLTKEEAVRKIKMLSYSKDRLYKMWHHKNVAIVYDELKSKKLVLFSSPIITKKNILKRVVVEKKKKVKVVKKRVKLYEKKKKKSKKNTLKIHYVNFKTAMRQAKAQHKLVFLKIRSTDCKYCDQLNRTLRTNREAKKLIKQYFKIVEINEDYEEVPVDVRISATPTIIFIRADNKKILMHFSGIQPLGELLEILHELVNDGHNGAYLKP